MSLEPPAFGAPPLLSLKNRAQLATRELEREGSISSANSEAIVECRLDIGPDESLHYWGVGDTSKPVLIMQHGMRDVGRCMLPVAEALSEHFYCVLPDLRGHGLSFRPGSYAIEHFLMDLRRLQTTLDAPTVHLLGHSLGGHITARYAGLYPGAVASLTLIEGLGPPRWEMPETAELERLAQQLDGAITTASYAANPRTLPSLQEAADRLVKNNPRLDPDWALQLARWGTSEAPQGEGFVWAFDPRAQEVFLGVSDARNFDYWSAVTAPTLVITGDLGHLYWREQFPANGYSGRFSDEELTERLTALGSPNHKTEHAEIAGAGHQVHYDQPEELACTVQRFLIKQLQKLQKTERNP